VIACAGFNPMGLEPFYEFILSLMRIALPENISIREQNQGTAVTKFEVSRGRPVCA
jgi:hypothetical protein